MLNFLAAFVIIYIGTRPVSFAFADMGLYAIDFQRYAAGEPLNTDKDVWFEIFIQTCSRIMSVEMFFFLCAVLYVLPLYVVSKKWFGNYAFYGFAMFVVSMSFWGYGTNGIRNGIATSLFLLAVSQSSVLLTVVWIFVAISIHKSMLLPTVAYIMSRVYKNPTAYFAGWFVCIPLSLAAGGAFESFFASSGLVEDDRLAAYLGGESLDLLHEIKVGFRWDFLIYSATGAFAGLYFIVKHKFEDATYKLLYCTYLTANAVWILVIRANFSNRFAYLSWFMLAALIIYPLLKSRIFTNQHRIVAIILLIYFAFTYSLDVKMLMR